MVVVGVVVGGGVVVVSGFRLSLHRLSLQQPPAKPDPLFPKVLVETEDIWPQSYRIQIKGGLYKLKIVSFRKCSGRQKISGYKTTELKKRGGHTNSKLFLS